MGIARNKKGRYAKKNARKNKVKDEKGGDSAHMQFEDKIRLWGWSEREKELYNPNITNEMEN